MSGKFREGRAEGLAEGRAELEKVASRMKADSVPIAQYTGLSEKAIKAV